MNNRYQISAFAIAIFASAAFTLSGCSSSGTYDKGYALSSDTVTYGTGPNRTKPRAQTEKVNISGIGGAKPAYEVQRSGGCNKDYKVLGKNYMVWNGTTSYIEEGTASWYGPGFNGKKTSNGEIYNQKGFTAAHKNLPLPSYLKVTNLKNGKKVIVRVNDRGPFVSDRIIDLSEGSARALDMIGTGTAKVRIEYIKVNSNGTYANAVGNPRGNLITPSALGVPTPAVSASTVVNKGTKSGSGKTAFRLKGTYIQLVACNSDTLATRIKNDVSSRVSLPVIIVNDNNINRVLAGPLSESKAQAALSALKAKGYTDCFIKRFN